MLLLLLESISNQFELVVLGIKVANFDSHPFHYFVLLLEPDL
jgi:hypothetical protein